MNGMTIATTIARSALAALLLTSGLSACGTGVTSSSGESAEDVVNVYNWAEYIAPETIETFEAEFGIKVNYDVFDSNEVLEAKLLAGSSGYDVVVPSASFMARSALAMPYISGI